MRAGSSAKFSVPPSRSVGQPSRPRPSGPPCQRDSSKSKRATCGSAIPWYAPRSSRRRAMLSAAPRTPPWQSCYETILTAPCGIERPQRLDQTSRWQRSSRRRRRGRSAGVRMRLPLPRSNAQPESAVLPRSAPGACSARFGLPSSWAGSTSQSVSSPRSSHLSSMGETRPGWPGYARCSRGVPTGARHRCASSSTSPNE